MPKSRRRFGKASGGEVRDPDLKALRNHRSDGAVARIHDGIVRGEVAGEVLFQKLKERARKEQPGTGCHAVPVIGVQKSDGIGKTNL